MAEKRAAKSESPPMSRLDFDEALKLLKDMELKLRLEMLANLKELRANMTQRRIDSVTRKAAKLYNVRRQLRSSKLLSDQEKEILEEFGKIKSLLDVPEVDEDAWDRSKVNCEYLGNLSYIFVTAYQRIITGDQLRKVRRRQRRLSGQAEDLERSVENLLNLPLEDLDLDNCDVEKLRREEEEFDKMFPSFSSYPLFNAAPYGAASAAVPANASDDKKVKSEVSKTFSIEVNRSKNEAVVKEANDSDKWLFKPVADLKSLREPERPEAYLSIGQPERPERQEVDSSLVQPERKSPITLPLQPDQELLKSHMSEKYPSECGSKRTKKKKAKVKIVRSEKEKDEKKMEDESFASWLAKKEAELGKEDELREEVKQSNEIVQETSETSDAVQQKLLATNIPEQKARGEARAESQELNHVYQQGEVENDEPWDALRQLPSASDGEGGDTVARQESQEADTFRQQPPLDEPSHNISHCKAQEAQEGVIPKLKCEANFQEDQWPEEVDQEQKHMLNDNVKQEKPLDNLEKERMQVEIDDGQFEEQEKQDDSSTEKLGHADVEEQEQKDVEEEASGLDKLVPKQWHADVGDPQNADVAQELQSASSQEIALREAEERKEENCWYEKESVPEESREPLSTRVVEQPWQSEVEELEPEKVEQVCQSPDSFHEQYRSDEDWKMQQYECDEIQHELQSPESTTQQVCQGESNEQQCEEQEEVDQMLGPVKNLNETQHELWLVVDEEHQEGKEEILSANCSKEDTHVEESSKWQYGTDGELKGEVNSEDRNKLQPCQTQIEEQQLVMEKQLSSLDGQQELADLPGCLGDKGVILNDWQQGESEQSHDLDEEGMKELTYSTDVIEQVDIANMELESDMLPEGHSTDDHNEVVHVHENLLARTQETNDEELTHFEVPHEQEQELRDTDRQPMLQENGEDGNFVSSEHPHSKNLIKIEQSQTCEPKVMDKKEIIELPVTAPQGSESESSRVHHKSLKNHDVYENAVNKSTDEPPKEATASDLLSGDLEAAGCAEGKPKSVAYSPKKVPRKKKKSTTSSDLTETFVTDTEALKDQDLHLESQRSIAHQGSKIGKDFCIIDKDTLNEVRDSQLPSGESMGNETGFKEMINANSFVEKEDITMFSSIPPNEAQNLKFGMDYPSGENPLDSSTECTDPLKSIIEKIASKDLVPSELSEVDDNKEQEFVHKDTFSNEGARIRPGEEVREDEHGGHENHDTQKSSIENTNQIDDFEITEADAIKGKVDQLIEVSAPKRKKKKKEQARDENIKELESSSELALPSRDQYHCLISNPEEMPGVSLAEEEMEELPSNTNDKNDYEAHVIRDLKTPDQLIGYDLHSQQNVECESSHFAIEQSAADHLQTGVITGEVMKDGLWERARENSNMGESICDKQIESLLHANKEKEEDQNEKAFSMPQDLNITELEKHPGNLSTDEDFELAPLNPREEVTGQSQPNFFSQRIEEEDFLGPYQDISQTVPEEPDQMASERPLPVIDNGITQTLVEGKISMPEKPSGAIKSHKGSAHTEEAKPTESSTEKVSLTSKSMQLPTTSKDEDASLSGNEQKDLPVKQKRQIAGANKKKLMERARNVVSSSAVGKNGNDLTVESDQVKSSPNPEQGIKLDKEKAAQIEVDNEDRRGIVERVKKPSRAKGKKVNANEANDKVEALKSKVKEDGKSREERIIERILLEKEKNPKPSAKCEAFPGEEEDGEEKKPRERTNLPLETHFDYIEKEEGEDNERIKGKEERGMRLNDDDDEEEERFAAAAKSRIREEAASDLVDEQAAEEAVRNEATKGRGNVPRRRGAASSGGEGGADGGGGRQRESAGLLSKIASPFQAGNKLALAAAAAAANDQRKAVSTLKAGINRGKLIVQEARKVSAKANKSEETETSCPKAVISAPAEPAERKISPSPLRTKLEQGKKFLSLAMPERKKSGRGDLATPQPPPAATTIASSRSLTASRESLKSLNSQKTSSSKLSLAVSKESLASISKTGDNNAEMRAAKKAKSVKLSKGDVLREVAQREASRERKEREKLEKALKIEEEKAKAKAIKEREEREKVKAKARAAAERKAKKEAKSIGQNEDPRPTPVVVKVDEAELTETGLVKVTQIPVKKERRTRSTSRETKAKEEKTEETVIEELPKMPMPAVAVVVATAQETKGVFAAISDTTLTAGRRSRSRSRGQPVPPNQEKPTGKQEEEPSFATINRATKLRASPRPAEPPEPPVPAARKRSRSRGEQPPPIKHVTTPFIANDALNGSTGTLKSLPSTASDEDEEDKLAKKVSFANKEKTAILRPEPEIKVIPGTMLYCFSPRYEKLIDFYINGIPVLYSETHEQPPEVPSSSPFSTFVPLPGDAEGRESGQLQTKPIHSTTGETSTSSTFQPYHPPVQPAAVKAPPPLISSTSAPVLGPQIAEERRKHKPGQLTAAALPRVDTSPRAFLSAMTAGISAPTGQPEDEESQNDEFRRPGTPPTLKLLSLKRNFLAARTNSLDRGGGLFGNSGMKRSESMVAAAAPEPAAPVGDRVMEEIRKSGGTEARRRAMQAEDALLGELEYYSVDFLGRRKIKKISKTEDTTNWEELFEKTANEKRRKLEEEREKLRKKEEEERQEKAVNFDDKVEKYLEKQRSISQPHLDAMRKSSQALKMRWKREMEESPMPEGPLKLGELTLRSLKKKRSVPNVLLMHQKSLDFQRKMGIISREEDDLEHRARFEMGGDDIGRQLDQHNAQFDAYFSYQPPTSESYCDDDPVPAGSFAPASAPAATTIRVERRRSSSAADSKPRIRMRSRDSSLSTHHKPKVSYEEPHSLLQRMQDLVKDAEVEADYAQPVWPATVSKPEDLPPLRPSPSPHSTIDGRGRSPRRRPQQQQLIVPNIGRRGGMVSRSPSGSRAGSPEKGGVPPPSDLPLTHPADEHLPRMLRPDPLQVRRYDAYDDDGENELYRKARDCYSKVILISFWLAISAVHVCYVIGSFIR